MSLASRPARAAHLGLNSARDPHRAYSIARLWSYPCADVIDSVANASGRFNVKDRTMAVGRGRTGTSGARRDRQPLGCLDREGQEAMKPRPAPINSSPNRVSNTPRSRLRLPTFGVSVRRFQAKRTLES